jgi:lipooligosaccharide transport system ATP-binding protein
MAEVGPVVRASGLTKRFGGLTAVEALDLAIRPGECFGLLGPNGAGKTSALRMVTSVSPPSGGQLRVFGLEVPRQGRAVKARLGVVPQENNLDDDLTVRENLLAHARFFGLRGREARQRADELLAFVELAPRADSTTQSLSGGMKRRLLVARALLNRPELLVLDEPTTGLDPQARQLVWGKLQELKRGGVTLLLTTHYMEEAEQLCDRLAILDRGRIIAEGAPRDLVARHIGREVLELELDAALHGRVLEAVRGHVAGHERVRDRLLLHAAGDAEALLELIVAQKLPLREARFRRATLEDVYLKLAGRALTEG